MKLALLPALLAGVMLAGPAPQPWQRIDVSSYREARWLANSYIRIYSKFDAEMVPSGRAGPVQLLWR